MLLGKWTTHHVKHTNTRLHVRKVHITSILLQSSRGFSMQHIAHLHHKITCSEGRSTYKTTLYHLTLVTVKLLSMAVQQIWNSLSESLSHYHRSASYSKHFFLKQFFPYVMLQLFFVFLLCDILVE